MADLEKLQRLKAAKKKVREHKMKKENNQKDDTQTLFNAESMTSSIHSNEGSLADNQFNPSNNAEDLPFTNYFVPPPTANTIDPIAFFDSLSSTNVANTIFNTIDEPTGKSVNFDIHEDSKSLVQPDVHVNGCLQNEVPPINSFSSTVASEPTDVVKDFQAFDTITYNNAETLRQLSSQMNQLVNLDSIDFNITNITNDLEKRNQELANMLNSEKMNFQQLNADLEIYKMKLAKVEEESRIEREEFERKINSELSPLREQLQTHMQTVGILVGEKSELGATLSQSQLMLKQKTSENEELHGRLKTSRSRVADLEKELNNLRQERSQCDRIDLIQSEKLREFDLMKKHKEEADLDISELRKKLEVSLNDNGNLLKETQELRAQLSLADIKIQQLTAGESAYTLTQIESLNQEKLLLEKHLSECKQSVKSMTQDREQASLQYQQYVQQLNAQLNALAQKLESVTLDNENLSKREQDLIKHISELERHLQNLQNEHLKSSVSIKNDNLDNIGDTFESLKLEKTKLEEILDGIRNERDELLKELLEKKNVIEELEGTIERLRVDQPDNAKLLAAIESDKVAAARAVSQNRQLKEQLEEMQNAFIKMSNDKMELMEKLESERHQNRELGEKLETTEGNLHKLTEAIEIKDRELTQIREVTNESGKQTLQLEHLEDRLRHYEAQENSYHALERELQDVILKANALNAENLQLKTVQNFIKNKESQNHSDVNGEVIQDTNVADLTEEANDSIHDNTVEEAHIQNAAIVNTLNKDLAMKRLEEKFTKTMENVANLEDEKQSLEHLVLQLQGETETIGEYIMLYQRQRAVLKQRAIEKEEQLKRLSADREEMRQKLEKLNRLIGKLMSEQNGIPVEILEQHRNIEKENLCVEHAKIKNEISEEINGTNGMDDNKRETASEIIALLSEIKTSNLVQSDENFHPCPWCSGKLITV